MGLGKQACGLSGRVPELLSPGLYLVTGTIFPHTIPLICFPATRNFTLPCPFAMLFLSWSQPTMD